MLGICSLVELVGQGSKVVPTKMDVSGDWVLVWADEFNGSGGVNAKNWECELNFVRNEKALQLYTNRAKNIRQQGGCLVIEAFYEKQKNKNYEKNSPQWIKNREYAEYTSGSVNSKNKFSFQYGKLEIRAKIEHGRGVWPALWALGNNINKVSWPACGEIDL